ncbi:MAG: cobalamin B12-binding domain-containing protein [Pseudomonadota bacterium]
MSNFEQGLEDRSDEDQAQQHAISAFAGLGEKLRSFYNRGKRDRVENRSEATLGARALFNTIEGEIIPRLMLTHHATVEIECGGAADPALLSSQDHERFLQAVMNDSAAAANAIAETYIARGVSNERILLDLLASAARRLGELWEEDLCDFTDVTIGTCRLHEIIRKNSGLSGFLDGDASADGPSILFSTACGDQHILGVIMVAEFFRAAGWRVWTEPGASCDELVKMLQGRHFDMLAVSVACDVFADDAAGDIKRLRSSSSNKDIKVVVGGQLLIRNPGLAKNIGADCVVNDPVAAPGMCRELLAAKNLHC